ncbi:hypothetical protein LTR91_012625 [Friedmanniomyces endolithicus]|uniref:Cytochrome b561 domain-containing protein n=1 Tax=Friedmanniomyces endolithicus TaxID=329885 RepID=A0AAN6KFE0_9PEZI|nr:hypothetical protein LTR94_020588 [Friedmanniomyces endolithicus]KAK0788216.1 hypothetical protein LTR38_011397 [Friedmanniomyces endolithicus]KAK0801876.1 hypothetical protein LTR59_005230 [Friedmanniomyces endolithicus]KAK0817425.1 hypothetical protein LTR75_003164 [Friedmanniomyces endolithicus]KAK0847513.1 hypothetical protein LTR03_006298 [Friedmanniomyces endolithicus]
MKHAILATAALSIGSRVYAAISKTCPEADVCYLLSIPNSTASSGAGDIYFQLSAPTSYQWIALGQGSLMAGSNIFVMYTSANGNNVTVSPRLGLGYRQPLHDTAAHITVLEGSGVSGGVMTANVRCSNCDSWSGGSMNFAGTSSHWIHAYKEGAALDSDDLAHNIQQHDQSDSFIWDLSQARGGADANPFVSSASGAVCLASSTTASGGPSSSSSGGGATGSSSTANATGSSSTANVDFYSLSYSKKQRMLNAHAVFACIAFVALMPMGAILIRVASFKKLVRLHVAIQALALVSYMVAVGLGLYLAINLDLLDQAHPFIGLVLFALLLMQPIVGLVHHRFYKKHTGRTLWSYAHLSVGRLSIFLGLINGGLGLQLAFAGPRAKMIYGIVAGVVGVCYLVAIAFGEAKRGRTESRQGQDEKERNGRDSEGVSSGRA